MYLDDVLFIKPRRGGGKILVIDKIKYPDLSPKIRESKEEGGEVSSHQLKLCVQ